GGKRCLTLRLLGTSFFVTEALRFQRLPQFCRLRDKLALSSRDVSTRRLNRRGRKTAGENPASQFFEYFGFRSIAFDIRDAEKRSPHARAIYEVDERVAGREIPQR